MSDHPAPGPAAGPGSRDRIRVVNVLDNLNTGGTELNAVRAALRLDRARFDVRFLCLQAQGPLRARLDAGGIPVESVRVPSLFSAEALRRGLEIRSRVRRENIQVVHAHDPYSNVLAAPWARLGGCQGVIASHRWWRSVHRRRVRMANRLAYRFANRVLANSASVGELVVREEGVPRDRLVVVPNFVENEAFTPLPAARRQVLRELMGLRPTDVAVGVVANLYPVKDHATLVRVAARLAHDTSPVRFVFVGDGTERLALESMARSLGVADRILMPGRLPHEPGLPGVFDVAVLSSREEGFPNFVVEAMASGRPVVATNVGGVPDAVADGQSGFLVAAGDDGAMASALTRLLSDEALRIRMGNFAAEQARSRYHVDVVIPVLQSLYEELAASSTG